MTPPVRPEFDPSQIDAAVKSLKSQGAPDEAIHAYLVSKGFTPVEPESLPSRVIQGVIGGVSQLRHPLDVAAGMAKGAGKSLMDAVLSPGVDEARPSAALSKGGNSSGRPIDTSPYDAAHGGITTAERTAGGLQTVANAAFPAVAGGVASKLGGGFIAKSLGLGAASGIAGAAQSPADPVAGGLTGAILGAGAGVAGKGATSLAGRFGSTAADLVGRPMESRAITAGPIRVGTIEGVGDRAARLNAPAIAKAGPLPVSDKPLVPADAGTATQRLARGLKASSPAAESVLRGALEPRGEGAVERVINHGLETTGLVNRESGILTQQHLHDLANSEGNEAYGKVFAGDKLPMAKEDHLARINDIANTPAGKKAVARGMEIAANKRDPIGSIATSGGTPPGYTPDQWTALKQTMTDRGMPVPDVPGGPQRLAPTLKQAHYIKLGFDDLLNGAPEPGSGGSGPHNAGAIRALKNDWLGIMDEHSPEYGKARKQYADTKQLENAAELGQQMFKLHPDRMAVEMKDMPEAAQQMVRRSGFDALAQRIENGPENIDKGLKALDRKRMRALFPDDASFQKFQDGLKQEAQMHATKQGVLGGSNTADKLADMADMAGVSLPDVFKAMKGNPLPLVAKGVKAVVGPRLRAGAENLAAERARQLVSPASASPRPATSSLMNTIHGQNPTLPDALDPSRGVNRPSPSPAAQSVRQQVDAMNRHESVRAHRPSQGRP